MNEPGGKFQVHDMVSAVQVGLTQNCLRGG